MVRRCMYGTVYYMLVRYGTVRYDNQVPLGTNFFISRGQKTTIGTFTEPKQVGPTTVVVYGTVLYGLAWYDWWVIKNKAN